MRRHGDPLDYRNSRGSDQPDSEQGSSRIGYCVNCCAGSVPVEPIPLETSHGPDASRWYCLTCYRKHATCTGAPTQIGHPHDHAPDA